MEQTNKFNSNASSHAEKTYLVFSGSILNKFNTIDHIEFIQLNQVIQQSSEQFKVIHNINVTASKL